MLCIEKSSCFKKDNASEIKFRHRLAGTAALLLAASLAACGGGGGSSDGGDDGNDDGGGSPSVFSVTSVTPDDGESGIEPDATLKASFNRDLLASSVGNIEFTKNNGGGPAAVPVSVSIDTASSVNIQPDAPLDILSRYTATVTTDIADGSGNPLSEAFSWSFTTRDGDWEQESLMGAGEQPDVAADPMGNGWMVWLTKNSVTDRFTVTGRYYDVAAGEWDRRALLLNSDITTDADTPRIAVDLLGNAIVAWVQDDAVYARYWQAGSAVDESGWSAAEQISGSDPVYIGNGTFLYVEFSSSNSARAVWLEQQGSGLPNLASNNYWAPNAAWTGPVSGPDLDVERNRANVSDFAADNVGNAILIWTNNDEPTIADAENRVYATRYDAATNDWISTTIETHNVKGAAQNPRIVFDNQGNAFAAWWRHADDFFGRLYVSRYEVESGAWSHATRIMGAREESEGRFPSLAVDPQDNAMVAFEVGEPYVAFYRADEGVWGDARKIGDYAGTTMSEIAFDGDGNATVVWTKNEGTVTNIFANRYAAATDSWSTEKRIEKSGGGSAEKPVIDALWDAGALAVWEDTGHVYSNRFSPE